jgi:hypothetical protein
MAKEYVGVQRSDARGVSIKHQIIVKISRGRDICANFKPEGALIVGLASKRRAMLESSNLNRS